MDKVTINNQVVFMRKFVKQAKIRAINNYTKEIRKLQNRKGSDEETSKHKRKAERLLIKVGILRKIKPDTVSRKALSKEKDWKAVLKEKNIPLEDQCYALLANYAAVQTEVEKFHKKNWDLVPKIATLFKDWEEKSKDPLNKQQRKEAKKLRISMKNVKLDKNSSNATPIGLKNDAEANEISSDKNAVTDSLVKIENTQEAIAVNVEGVENKLSQKDSNSMSPTLKIDKMAKAGTLENIEIKREKITPRKKVNARKSVSTNNLKTVKINLNELQDSKETLIENTNNYIPDENTSSDSFRNVENTEETIVTNDEPVNSKPPQNDSKTNSFSVVGADIMGKEETSASENEDISESENEKLPENENEELPESENEELPESENEENSESENEELPESENEEISERENEEILDSENEEPSESENEEFKETTVMPRNKSPVKLQAEKRDQDIQSRLKAISNNSQKADTKANRQFKAKVTASKKIVTKNNLKAVTMLNLNELQDLDEIPIEKTNEIDEEVGENKRKKDSFFLGKGGEVPSESEDEDAANREQAVKKRKFDNFDKKPNDFSKRRSLPSDSRSNFRENGFQRNSRFGDRNNSFNNKGRQNSDGFQRNQSNSRFGDRNNSFNNKESQNSDFKNKAFKNKSFGDSFNNKERQNSDFKSKGFKNQSFGDSFNSKERQGSDFKSKGFKNKSFGEKFPSQQFKQQHTEAKNKEPFQKNNPSSLKKDEKPLHPSWEAKKKLKEAATSKFQGKRMVFDD